MRMKQAKPSPRGRLGYGCAPGDPVVATTIHINGQTFEMLSNVALSREFANVAKASHGVKVKLRDRGQSVAAVIEELIERHRDELEDEARLVKGGPRGH
jgi:hypothetical protein